MLINVILVHLVNGVQEVSISQMEIAKQVTIVALEEGMPLMKDVQPVSIVIKVPQFQQLALRVHSLMPVLILPTNVANVIKDITALKVLK